MEGPYKVSKTRVSVCERVFINRNAGAEFNSFLKGMKSSCLTCLLRMDRIDTTVNTLLLHKKIIFNFFQM